MAIPEFWSPLDISDYVTSVSTPKGVRYRDPDTGRFISSREASGKIGGVTYHNKVRAYARSNDIEDRSEAYSKYSGLAGKRETGEISEEEFHNEISP